MNLKKFEKNINSKNKNLELKLIKLFNKMKRKEIFFKQKLMDSFKKLKIQKN